MRGDLSDLILRVDFLGEFLDACDGGLDGGLDALLEGHRVGAGGDVAQALADHAPRQHGGGGGAVTGDVVGLLGDFLDQLGADLLVGILELDLLGDRHAVVGDGGGAPLLVEHDVAALGPERDAHGVGELVHARLERATSLLVECDHLRHCLCLHDEGICHSHSQCESASTLDRRVLMRQPGRLLVRSLGLRLVRPPRPAAMMAARTARLVVALPHPGRDVCGTALSRRWHGSGVEVASVRREWPGWRGVGAGPARPRRDRVRARRHADAAVGRRGVRLGSSRRAAGPPQPRLPGPAGRAC